MKTCYYLDWFDEKGFSEKLTKLLHNDIANRKSLVMISADKEDTGIDDVFEKTWFNQANIIFDEYWLINCRTHKEDARQLIQNAPVIFLCGGSPSYQKSILTEFELPDLIKNSEAIVMGTSAGGMNMSSKYIIKRVIYDGMALSNFSFEAHFDYDNIVMIEERLPLSEKTDIYVGADKDGAVRVSGGKIDIIGSVYLVSGSTVQKLTETL
jgi:cyanophycinase